MAKCTQCSNEFSWDDVYMCQNTPGERPPTESGRWGARVYCPSCGALVVEEMREGDQLYSIKRFGDKKEGWNWVGENSGDKLPPSPTSLWGKRIPAHLVPYFEETSLNIGAVKAYESDHANDRESTKEGLEKAKEGYRILEKNFSYNDNDHLKADSIFQEAFAAGLNRHDMACALGSIAVTILDSYGIHFETAEEYAKRSVELDPAAYWQAHYIIGLALAAREEGVQAKEAHKTARRAASPQNKWWNDEQPFRVKQLAYAEEFRTARRERKNR